MCTDGQGPPPQGAHPGGCGRGEVTVVPEVGVAGGVR